MASEKDSKQEDIFTATCCHCGDNFQSNTGKVTKQKAWCGYCETVLFSKIDGEQAEWPPSISKTEAREIRPNGHVFKLQRDENDED